MAVSEDLHGVHDALENMAAHIAPQRLTDDEWAFLRLLQGNLLSLAEQAWSMEQSLFPCGANEMLHLSSSRIFIKI